MHKVKTLDNVCTFQYNNQYEEYRKATLLMYKNIIDIHREVPNDVLKMLMGVADNAFNNRAGRVKNVSTFPYRFVYEGGERSREQSKKY